MVKNTGYSIIFEFIRNYSGSDFRDINNHDHFMTRLNRVLHNARQFIWVSDISSLELKFTSQQVTDFFGIEPEKYNLSQNLSRTHPSDLRRRTIARANLLKAGNELYIKKAGTHLESSNFRIRNSNDEYIDVLVQCYLFYSGFPAATVYLLTINTMLDDILLKCIRKGHYHWYSGNDLAYFRFPDEELIKIGANLTDRELEVIRYIHMGMGTKKISDKLGLSIHTIATHRRNIIKKMKKTSILEVIYELEGTGMI
jgi:hypothetical protein